MTVIGAHNPIRTVPDDAVCLRCGYALRGLPTCVCPECGSGFDPANRDSYGPWRRRPSSREHRGFVPAWLAASVVLAFALACAGLPPIWMLGPILFAMAFGPPGILAAILLGQMCIAPMVIHMIRPTVRMANFALAGIVLWYGCGLLFTGLFMVLWGC